MAGHDVHASTQAWRRLPQLREPLASPVPDDFPRRGSHGGSYFQEVATSPLNCWYCATSSPRASPTRLAGNCGSAGSLKLSTSGLAFPQLPIGGCYVSLIAWAGSSCFTQNTTLGSGIQRQMDHRVQPGRRGGEKAFFIRTSIFLVTFWPLHAVGSLSGLVFGLRQENRRYLTLPDRSTIGFPHLDFLNRLRDRRRKIQSPLQSHFTHSLLASALPEPQST